MTAEPPATRPTRQGLDLARIADAIRLRWKLFAALVVLVAGLVLVAMMLIPARWTSTTLIRIEPDRRSQTEAESAPRGVPPDQGLIDTEVSLMTSRSVLASVIRELKLAMPEGTENLSENMRFNLAVDNLKDSVSVKREGATYLVALSVRSRDPEKSAEIANAIAEAYLTYSQEARITTAAEQSQLLDGQLSKLGEDVRTAEARVATFRAQHGIVEGGVRGTVTDQRIEPLAAQLGMAEAEAASAQSRYQAARAQMDRGDIDAVGGVLDSPVITDLRRQRAEVVRKKNENDAVYGPRDPRSIGLNEQLSSLDGQIRQEAERIVGGLAAAARAASSSLQSQRGQLESLRREQASNSSAAVSAESLQREAEAKRTVYNQMAQTAQEAAQRRQAAIAFGEIVDRAAPSAKPSFPNKPLITSLALILGLLTGLGVVIALEMLNKGLRQPQELESLLGVPFIASVPFLSARRLGRRAKAMAPWDYLLSVPESTYAETLRGIRSAIQLAPGEPPKLIGIVSSMEAEGKTSLSVGLARTMALSGDRVLLVACDIRRNALASFVSANEAGGLLEVIHGKISLDEALVRDGETGLLVLPLSNSGFTVRDEFGGESMKALLQILRGRFDHVVFDTPPLLAVSDARAVAAMMDANLLVVRWNSTSSFAVQAAARQLRKDGTVLWGVAFSLTDVESGATANSDPATYIKEYYGY